MRVEAAGLLNRHLAGGEDLDRRLKAHAKSVTPSSRLSAACPAPSEEESRGRVVGSVIAASPMLIAEGIDLAEVAGHAHPGVTLSIYGHMMHSEDSASAEAVPDFGAFTIPLICNDMENAARQASGSNNCNGKTADLERLLRRSG